MKTHLLLRILNAASLLLALAANGLANFLRLGGLKTGDISALYPSLFTPAPYAFFIWAVIYLLLIGFALFQFGVFDKTGARSTAAVEQVGGFFIANCLFNSAWIVSWHMQRLGLCVLLIFAMLITLIAITGRLRGFDTSTRERWLVCAPFSLYFGWVTVASIACVAVWLVQIQWNGWGLNAPFWTIVTLVLGCVIGTATALRRRDWLYAAAVAWGYAGILVQHIFGFSGAYPLIITTAALCEAILLFVLLRLWMLERRSANG